MSLDPSAFPRSHSPASSDSSLTRPRVRGKEETFKKDKNYRRYASSIERALSLFDTALQEWADYISFLSRLLKALQSHPPDLPIVPHKTIVAKRLAQCLNPSLPSGVHQKALEVYTYIFSLIKPEGLSHDLALYLPGIAPTLTFASLSVRPLFLSLLETYLPDVEPWAIRPALKAIILALLPGLEEETSDDFETTLRIINKFRDVSSQMRTRRPSDRVDANGQYFWQCLFLASITNPSRRLGVLAYLNRYLPKLGMTDHHKAIGSDDSEPQIPADLLAAADSVISPEPGLLIRCFATGLTDDQLLVQRNFLDLLVTHLPLHSPILQSRITRDDLKKLVIAAAGVVARRDMSLNRRLWAWFLGPDPSSSGNERTSLESPKTPSQKPLAPIVDGQEYSQSQYFSRFGLESLVQGILEMIQHESIVPSERTRPLRISLSLMDRWEVGGSVVPEVFLPIMRSIQDYENLVPQNQFEEVFRSASSFFDGVESSLIFSELLSLIDFRSTGMDSDIDGVSRNLSLAEFIIANFNVREEEMLLIHIPLLVLSLIVKMDEMLTLTNESHGTPENRRAVSNQLLQIVNECISLLSERAFSKKATSEKTNGSQVSVAEISPEEILARIHSFYDKSKDGLDLPPLPFHPKIVGELIIRESHRLNMSVLEGNDVNFTVKESLNLFVALLKKAPKSRILRDGKLYRAINNCLTSSDVRLTTSVFAVISSIVSATTSLYTTHTTGLHVTYEQIYHLVPILVRQLWAFLSPSSPKFHVEAVRSLWLLHSVSWPDHLVEASITSLMVKSSLESCHGSTADEAQKFFVLWNHSHHGNYELPLLRGTEELFAGHDRGSYQSSMLERPLFIVLDLLSQGLNEASQIVHEWLQDLSSIHKVFRSVISRLESLFTLESKSRDETERITISADNFKECHYLFRTLSNILVTLSNNGWIALLTHSVSSIDKRHDPSASEDQSDRLSLQYAIFNAALAVIEQQESTVMQMSPEEEKLQQIVLLVLRQLLVGPGAERIIESNIIEVLIERLSLALDQDSGVTQRAAIDTLLAALKIKFLHAVPPQPPPTSKHRRAGSRDTLASSSLLSISTDRVDKVQQTPLFPQPPPQLLDCLLKGISSSQSHKSVDKWVLLLCECLPLYHGTIFQILLMLVECFCREIRSSYDNLQQVFKKTANWSDDGSEHVIVALLAGLETCLATSHERLLLEEANAPSVKSPDQSQGFFGNMVSGVFTSEGHPTRSAAANNRLTVLLCFQDAVRLCFSIWAWGASGKNSTAQDAESVASFQYTSLRMRNRSRRILEHLFTAEALECLETLVEMWSKSATAEGNASTLIFNLLHTLDGSRPKFTIPAIFNAIYSRTNPHAIDPSRKSAMTLDITETELTAFLVTYARSLDDDVLDEIWNDCITFLRDVLANPFPHRQILPRLVEFAAILGAKMENTNFGEDRRMRKDLGDLLLRLLTAIFTSKPMGLSQEAALSSRTSFDHDNSLSAQAGPDDVLSILALSMPAFITTLGESDRIGSAMANVSTNVIGPLFRSRLFPNNINRNVLSLLQDISKVPAASKYWKKDIADAFNDHRFFGSHVDIVKTGWMSLLRQWIIVDKDRLSDILGRLTPPTSAGIMFGVGASAARLEADRKAQLNLRRIALLLLSADDDHFVVEFPALLQKMEDLLAATNVSSPSSTTRAEIFMVLRSLVLKTSTTHLAPFWPLINTELQEAISSITQDQPSELYSPYSLLQGCKLLDILILTAPDDFQLQEWLFVTDTIDAIYPPHRWEPTALADEVSQVLGSRGAVSPAIHAESNDVPKGLKTPSLNSDQIRETAKDEIVDRVLRPFFDRLSIHAFESTYSMGVPDLETCKDDLLADLFNESTMAN